MTRKLLRIVPTRAKRRRALPTAAKRAQVANVLAALAE
jgi:hypothetical protein